MLLLVIGLAVFLGVHSVSIVAPAWRDAQVARRGEFVWKGLYALASIVGFVLLIRGYGLAQQSPVALYTPPAGLRIAALVLMVPAFPLLLSAYLPGRIKTAARHPMILAVTLWALAHLLVNGTVAGVLLFGGFLAWSVADRLSFSRRTPRPVRGAPPSAVNDAIAVLAGLALYVAFLLWAHRWLTGVSPMA
ncbi:MAG: NnrU family protein [Steroidobacteraceae bacterium]